MSDNQPRTPGSGPLGRLWRGRILAVLTTALTLGVWRLLEPWGGQQGSLLLFAIPVTLSAWYGGLGPGLLATLLAALAEIFFLSPAGRSPFRLDGPAVHVLLFGFAGAVISALCEGLHAALRRAEAHERDARQALARLEQTLARQRQTEDALRLSEERLRLALEAANVGLWDYQPITGNCYYNEPWYRIIGYQPGEVKPGYDTWRSLLHPDDRAMAEIAMADALAPRPPASDSRPPYSIEFRMRCKDNSWKWVLSRAEVLERTVHGLAQRMIGVHVDIDRQKRDEAELRQAKEAAEVANQSKSDFLAHMTHELRTPLNGVIGMIDLLSHTALDEQQRRYAGVARSSADLLFSVINDILDFSKIEAGKLELEEIDFSLPDVMDEVHALLAQPSRDKGLTLRTACSPLLSRPLRGDPARLRQVLINLVNNAIKFTEGGELGGVSVSAVPLQEDNATRTPDPVILPSSRVRVRFEVRDSGIGIGQEALPRLFQAFSQADNSTRRKYGGTGLGLVISKHLVERMDGMIGVESEPGKGSLFWFVVHLSASEHSASGVEGGWWRVEGKIPDPTLHPPPLRGRILVVEDNRVNAEVAGEILRRAGYECVKVDNGRAALEAVRQQMFDLILMDCQLPEMDGLEAARQIRRLEQGGRFCRSDGQPAPIIALTATATRQNRAECFAAGMNDYLSKPLDARRMLRVLADHLGSGEADSQLSTGNQTRSVVETASAPTPADLGVALERIGGSEQLLARLAGVFLAETGGVADHLRDALEAGRAVEVEHAAHRLKGQAGTFEATAVVHLAGELERLGKQHRLDQVGDLLPRLCDELDALRRQLSFVIRNS
jgi:two-component system, sensor histidine kinase and response regulator